MLEPSLSRSWCHLHVQCHWEARPGASCLKSPPENGIWGLSIRPPTLDARPQGDRCRESPGPWSWAQFQPTWKQQGHKQGAGQEKSLHVAERTASRAGPVGGQAAWRPLLLSWGRGLRQGKGCISKYNVPHHKGHIIFPLCTEQALNHFPQDVDTMPDASGGFGESERTGKGKRSRTRGKKSQNQWH